MTQILIDIDDSHRQLQRDIQNLEDWQTLLSTVEEEFVKAWQAKIDRECQGFEDSFQFFFSRSRRDH